MHVRLDRNEPFGPSQGISKEKNPHTSFLQIEAHEERTTSHN